MPREPLVLIHGFSATRGVWQPVLESLEGKHEVLAVNLAGHVGGPELPGDADVSVGALVDAATKPKFCVIEAPLANVSVTAKSA